MNARTLSIIAALAALAALLAVIGQNLGGNRAPAPGPNGVGERFLPGLAQALDQIDEVIILTAGNETVATLRRTAETWVVTEQDDYPADVTKIRTVLTTLAEAEIVEEKTSNEAFYSRLGVGPIENSDAGGVAVSLHGETGEFPTVILGDESGRSYRFARRADQAGSVLVNRDPDVPRAASQWVIPDIIDIAGSRVQRVEIAHADGEQLTLEKASREESTLSVQAIPEGRELQYASVANSVGNVLRDLTLEDVARAEPPLRETQVTAEFWTFDGLVVTITGISYEEQPWITVAARFDAGQAGRFATDTVDEGLAEAGFDGESPDPVADAEAVNGRLSGWRFRIPTHKYDQLARRMDDLLRTPE